MKTELESTDLQIRILDVQGNTYLRQGEYPKAWSIFEKQVLSSTL